MAPLIYLDTHVVAWMFAGRTDLLPAGIQALLNEQDLVISPAVELELQYLFEIRRTAEPAKVVLESLQSEVGLRVCDLPFPAVVRVALDQNWTRDPFDRLIVSQAILGAASLVTKDDLIHEHFPLAVWTDLADAVSEIQRQSVQTGKDSITSAEIDAEIASVRRARRQQGHLSK